MTKAYFFRLFIGLTSVISSVVTSKAAILRPSFKPSSKNSQNKNSLQESMNFKEITGFFEQKYGIPTNLLAAIAKVESANSPWAINALGKSRTFPNKNAALKYVKNLQQQGVTNINVGYMQINLASHRRKFKTLEESLTPYHNIAYAAHLLKRLYLRYGSWESAVRFYHSYSTKHNLPYQQKVFKVWSRGVVQPISNKTPQKTKAHLKMVLSPSAGVSKNTTNR
jgi:soluble lytic murein transglycosylase-like protein